MYAVVVAAVRGLDRLAVNHVVVARSRGDWKADVERRRRVGVVGARPVRVIITPTINAVKIKMAVPTRKSRLRWLCI